MSESDHELRRASADVLVNLVKAALECLQLLVREAAEQGLLSFARNICEFLKQRLSRLGQIDRPSAAIIIALLPLEQAIGT